MSADSQHGGSTGLQQDLDTCCQEAGLWPDAVLSGHAHLYQRFTRMIHARETPYVVSGSGGFAATMPLGGLPRAPLTVGAIRSRSIPWSNSGISPSPPMRKSCPIPSRLPPR